MTGNNPDQTANEEASRSDALAPADHLPEMVERIVQEFDPLRIILFGSLRLAAYLSQQAAEKAIKATLVRHQIEFPFSHVLDQLIDLLPEHWSIKSEFPDLSWFSR